jgi:ABC-type glycerol-3-phosphate transport system substrate-binding protein
MTIDEYKENYVDVAAEDFIYRDEIYSIPLYVDTLALYYNTKLLEKYKIYTPPTTWQQLVSYVHQVTEKTTNGQDILTSGISLGTNNNINRASDILYAMMLQKGTLMTSPDNASATFALPTEKITSEDYYPGTESLDFYTSFADPNNVNYTWNPSMLGSLEAFEKGYAAMTINYSYQQPNIDKFKDPSVRYEISYLPRIETTDDPVSYANYWSESVNKQSKYSAWAWHFIKFMSEKSDSINIRSGRPTALREDAKGASKIFDEQAYYAKSFYKVDSDKVDQIFGNMIDDVSVEKVASQDAITKAQNEVTALMINQRK